MNLHSVFNDAWVVTSQVFPYDHRERMLKWARSEAASLKNSVAIKVRNDITGEQHWGFIHPDGHYSHYSMCEEARGINEKECV